MYMEETSEGIGNIQYLDLIGGYRKGSLQRGLCTYMLKLPNFTVKVCVF